MHLILHYCLFPIHKDTQHSPGWALVALSCPVTPQLLSLPRWGEQANWKCDKPHRLRKSSIP